MSMLRPSALTRVLANVNSGGVYGALLFNNEGALLAFSGPADRDARVTAAISSHIWATYSKRSTRSHSSLVAATPDHRLNSILMECEEGRVCVMPVAGLLVCVYARPDVGFGMLKLKTEALAKCLELPLIQVACE